ncbi:MAG: metallophosphoesterase family protein [Firmicutes bacterium]|nr:metallophosphoesterase family protein [Bacillota bacterium]
MPEPLRFRTETFKIVQLTDTHWTNFDERDRLTRQLMETVLDSEQPDLVFLTGDMLGGADCKDADRGMRQLVHPIEERGLSWTAVMGNHDDESTLRREELWRVMESCAHFVGKRGPRNITGVGNYVLPVMNRKGERPAAFLWGIDSSSYATTDIGGWGWITRDQIAWYERTARQVRRRWSITDEERLRVPALAFFHIPLPEYDEVWRTQVCYGQKHEDVCAPKINTGFFAALHEVGEVIGTFVGHDHINDFWGTLYGIRLCYGRCSGYGGYGKEGFPCGARVIELQEGVRDFRTWLRLEDGRTIIQQPEHRPLVEGQESGNREPMSHAIA